MPIGNGYLGVESPKGAMVWMCTGGLTELFSNHRGAAQTGEWNLEVNFQPNGADDPSRYDDGLALRRQLRPNYSQPLNEFSKTFSATIFLGMPKLAAPSPDAEHIRPKI